MGALADDIAYPDLTPGIEADPAYPLPGPRQSAYFDTAPRQPTYHQAQA